MRKILLFALAALALALCGCAMPNTVARTVDDRPTLAFKSAPPEAALFVDGVSMGPVAQYDGNPRVLAVESGTHTVMVKLGQEILFEKRVFVEGSLKTISIK